MKKGEIIALVAVTLVLFLLMRAPATAAPPNPIMRQPSPSPDGASDYQPQVASVDQGSGPETQMTDDPGTPYTDHQTNELWNGASWVNMGGGRTRHTLGVQR